MLVSNFIVGWEARISWYETSYQLQITNLEFLALHFQVDCQFVITGTEAITARDETGLWGSFEGDQLPSPAQPFKMTGPRTASGVQKIPARTSAIFYVHLTRYRDTKAVGFVKLSIPALTLPCEFRRTTQVHNPVSVLLHASSKHEKRPLQGRGMAEAVDVSYEPIALASGKAENQIFAISVSAGCDLNLAKSTLWLLNLN